MGLLWAVRGADSTESGKDGSSKAVWWVRVDACGIGTRRRWRRRPYWRMKIQRRESGSLLPWLRKMPASARELRFCCCDSPGLWPIVFSLPHASALHCSQARQHSGRINQESVLARAASITLRAPQTGLMQAGIVQATARTTWLCAGADRPTPAWDALHGTSILVIARLFRRQIATPRRAVPGSGC